jgi:hypothetical protein
MIFYFSQTQMLFTMDMIYKFSRYIVELDSYFKKCLVWLMPKSRYTHLVGEKQKL